MIFNFLKLGLKRCRKTLKAMLCSRTVGRNFSKLHLFPFSRYDVYIDCSHVCWQVFPVGCVLIYVIICLWMERMLDDTVVTDFVVRLMFAADV